MTHIHRRKQKTSKQARLITINSIPGWYYPFRLPDKIKIPTIETPRTKTRALRTFDIFLIHHSRFRPADDGDGSLFGSVAFVGPWLLTALVAYGQEPSLSPKVIFKQACACVLAWCIYTTCQMDNLVETYSTRYLNICWCASCVSVFYFDRACLTRTWYVRKEFNVFAFFRVPLASFVESHGSNV